MFLLNEILKVIKAKAKEKTSKRKGLIYDAADQINRKRSLLQHTSTGQLQEPPTLLHIRKRKNVILCILLMIFSIANLQLNSCNDNVLNNVSRLFSMSDNEDAHSKLIDTS